jgi:hypothetical protein
LLIVHEVWSHRTWSYSQCLTDGVNGQYPQRVRAGTVFFLIGEGPRSRRYGRTAALRLIVQPCDDNEDDCYFLSFSFSGGMKLTGENRSANLSTTNLTWTNLGSNPGLRGGRPATNRQSRGRARRDFHLQFNSS